MHNRVSAFVHVTTQGWKSLEQGVGTITVHSQSPAFSPFATERQRQCAASNHLERVRALVNRQQPLQQDSQVHAGVARRGHALTLRPGLGCRSAERATRACSLIPYSLAATLGPPNGSSATVSSHARRPTPLSCPSNFFRLVAVYGRLKWRSGRGARARAGTAPAALP